ncbi:hypothetical protein INS49_013272 [Diaporthe citri]|uniref:uncharacterized protein n=1 Tax=Diaporthe citri TaxID=83186 RepID=UPI001C7FDDC8|nr:uncharacterized protein INS49_013272 [Diaporthe citri]KAG6357395.1 hypothetical protein INS49_013272 [Diaporthe citri]
MASDNELEEVTEPEATEAHETRASQGNHASDTARVQQAARDTNEVHQPVFRLFDLPPEIRAIIFGFACTEEPDVKLPGPLPTGIDSLMLSLGGPHLRAEVAEARFKKTAIPGIRRLTINFELTDKTWFDLDSDVRQTLAWMWQRSKRGNQARYPWYLEHLRLRGIRYDDSSALADGGGKWYFAYPYPKPSCTHWSQDFSLQRLRRDGITVDVEVEHNPFPR